MEFQERPILVVANPVSTHRELTDSHVLAPLAAAGIIGGEDDADRVMWTPNASYAGLVDSIASRIKDGALVVSAGGDGMANIACNAVRQSGKDEVCLAFAPCGNACDISNAMHGGNIFGQAGGLLDLLQHGEAQPISAIEAVRNRTDQRVAIGYLGVGTTARISRRFGDSQYRDRRPASDTLADIRDGLSILGIFATDSPFRYRQIVQSPAGEVVTDPVHQVHELLFASGNVFGKKMGFDVDPHGKEVIMTEFRSRRFWRILARRAIMEAARDGLRGETLDTFSILVGDEGHYGTAIQFDGEVVDAPPGTRLDFKALAWPESALRVLSRSQAD
jgi:diacylglycerol kinase family enzyme